MYLAHYVPNREPPQDDTMKPLDLLIYLVYSENFSVPSLGVREILEHVFLEKLMGSDALR